MITSTSPIVLEAAKLNTEDLRALNEYVVNILKQRNRIASANAMSTFRIGERVSFYHRKRNTNYHGTVESFKLKNVVVRHVDQFGHTTMWTVPAMMLRKLNVFDAPKTLEANNA